jgi:hypothetical protein
MTSCRFIDEVGQRVDPEQSYDNVAYDIEDDDGVVEVYIDCLLEQIGGRLRIWW